MNEILERRLITCLEEIEKGRPFEEVLALYPEDKERLRPLLETAATLANLPVQPTLAAQMQSKKAFLQEAAALKASSGSRRGNFSLRGVLSPVLGLVLILLLFTSGLITAANSAVPGDLLYQTKLGYENMRFNLAGAAAKEGLKEQYAQERLQEVRRLLGNGDEAIVMFSGEITAISANEVRIVDINVQLVPDVEIVGKLVVGRMAAITGRTANGLLEAIMIEVAEGVTEEDGPADEAKPSPTMTPTSTVTPSLEVTETTKPSPTATPTVTATTLPTSTAPPTAVPDDSDEDEGENDNENNNEGGSGGESGEDEEHNDNDDDNESDDDDDNDSDDEGNDNDSDEDDNDNDN